MHQLEVRDNLERIDDPYWYAVEDGMREEIGDLPLSDVSEFVEDEVRNIIIDVIFEIEDLVSGEG